MTMWQPTSWQSKPCQQQPEYPSSEAVDEVIDTLCTLPPLVTPYEIDRLKHQLALAAKGERFLLQGGDCAESYAECRADNVTTKLKILLQISLILIHGLRKPVIRVGRVAGQFAKPRSSSWETREGLTLPTYRGDLINESAFTQQGRTPNPARMLEGYHWAALTLNYIRGLVEGGFADLHHPEYWNLDFAKQSSMAHEYQKIATNIADALNFLQAIRGTQLESLERIDFFTSHEALLLPYEQALTRRFANTNSWYNLSTHFPWIGMRTAELDHGHVEYMRGIANPIAVKIGPKMTVSWLKELIETLNPHNEPGRLTLIHRFGEELIASHLPPLIDAVKSTGITLLWSCDPMHGNTKTTQSGIKTRRFEDILSELKQAFHIHQEMNSILGGIHFEMTGENVTECTGGAKGITEEDLKHAYKSLVDPRLNYDQAMEMAMLIVKEIGSSF